MTAIAAPRTVPAAREAAARVGSAWISVALALAVAGLYVAIGEWATASRHVISLDALATLGRADLVWHGEPAKLAAVGFGAPPLPVLALLPVSLVSGGLDALPVTSALLAGVAVALLDRTLGRIGMGLPLRAPVLVALLLDPLLAFHAGAGTGAPLELALLAAALYGLVGWAVDASPRGLLLAGTGFGLLVLVRFEFAAWWLVGGLVVALALAARGARREEVDGTALAFGAPGAAAIAVYLLLTALTVGDPFAPLEDAWKAGGVADLGAGEALERLTEMLTGTAMLALVAVPALAWSYATRRDVVALGLGGLLVAAALTALAHALAADRPGPLALRAGLPILLAAVVGAAWCWRGAGAHRPVIYATTLALLLAGDFASWRAMRHHPVQDGERAWTQAVRTGDDQDGASAERAMATALPSQVVADEGAVAAVIALAGAERFVTRAGRGDDAWRVALPRARWVLATPGDAVDRALPGLFDGTAPGRLVVRSSGHYVLARRTP
jgi:hypothetical protein